MADSRSVMQEFRFLDQKRRSGALTPAEEARYAELSDLVGFEQPAPARGGFDVTAAAAQLRESLLPAGLRSRPADAPPPPSDPLPAWTPPAPAAPPADRFAEPEPPLSVDPYFDPASLGQEVRPQAWNPEAPGYDPDAPYDEAAWIAAGYDPNATYDWSALGEAAPATDVASEGTVDTEPSFELEPDLTLDSGEELTAPPAEPPPLQFGEYDAMPAAAPALAALGEADSGGSEGDSLPGGAPLELGEAPLGWLAEGALDGGFELASDGSFGEAAGPPLLTPWSEADSAAPSERWESIPALDLSTPYAPTVIPAEPPPSVAAAPSPSAQAAPEPAFESLPAESQLEPLHLTDLDPATEIDIPPEIAAAFDAPAAEPESEPVPVAPSGTAMVSGVNRVVVHLLDGRVLRGTLANADLEAPELPLDQGPPGSIDPVPSSSVKAIFFMLAHGEQAPAAEGKRVRVTFHDGRQVAGFSTDYRQELTGFFMIPADTRTSTGRIWVYQAAVKQVSVS